MVSLATPEELNMNERWRSSEWAIVPALVLMLLACGDAILSAEELKPIESGTLPVLVFQTDGKAVQDRTRVPAVWLGVTNRVVQSGTTNSVTGNLFLPKTPEVMSHDADGNLTNDGHWAYVWDLAHEIEPRTSMGTRVENSVRQTHCAASANISRAEENRLTRLVAPTAIPTGARYALNFTNDWRGRRTSKVVSNWTGSAWSKSYEHKFVYDGWNLIATLDSANTLLYSFQWGTDLSGAQAGPANMQGAGGVGGRESQRNLALMSL